MFLQNLLAGLGWIFSSWRRILGLLAVMILLYAMIDPVGARALCASISASIFHAVEPLLVFALQIGLLIGAVRFMWTGKLFPGSNKKKH